MENHRCSNTSCFFTCNDAEQGMFTTCPQCNSEIVAVKLCPRGSVVPEDDDCDGIHTCECGFSGSMCSSVYHGFYFTACLIAALAFFGCDLIPIDQAPRPEPPAPACDADLEGFFSNEGVIMVIRCEKDWGRDWGCEAAIVGQEGCLHPRLHPNNRTWEHLSKVPPEAAAHFCRVCPNR